MSGPCAGRAEHRPACPRPTGRLNSLTGPNSRVVGEMAMRLVFAFAAAVLVTGADPKADPAKEDLKLLQGLWRVTEISGGGERLPGEPFRPSNWTYEFKGDRCVMTSDGQSYECKIRLSPGGTSKAADLVVPRADGGETVISRMIYEVNGGRLRLAYSAEMKCFRNPDDWGGRRPQAFDDTAIHVLTAVQPKS